MSMLLQSREVVNAVASCMIVQLREVGDINCIELFTLFEVLHSLVSCCKKNPSSCS